MIEIYLKNNTNYKSNGDITLDPTLCTYKDSEKLLTLEHFQDEEGRWKYIDFENVIAIEKNDKKILYRIYNVVRSLYSVTAYARPIFYDLIDKILLDVRPTNKLGQEALNIILADTPFTGHSNLTTLSTSYYIRKNIVEALLGNDENSFLNRWGGEFYCENYDVYINDRIGSDNGVRVEFGYNLNEIEEDINIEEVVTRIIPVGFNGITLEGNAPWVDSPLILKYTKPKMRVITLSDVKVKANAEDEEGFDTIEEARTELIRRCNKLYEGGIDKPTVNYKIDMINLANTTEYENFKMLVNVGKGDTVTCYIPHLDIDVKARVIDYEKDLLTGEYISIELGNAVDNFFNKQADIQATVNKITNSNGTVNAGEIQGVINAIQTQFKALRDIAQPQDVRAILFEDRVEDSPTFGCMVLGTMGFEIASKFKPGTTEWDFRTFGTGQGFVADCIIAGILMSRNGVSWLNLDNGTFSFADEKFKYDGLSVEVEGDFLTKNNGQKAIEMQRQTIYLHDWEGTTRIDPVGLIYSSRRNINGSTTKLPGIIIANKKDAYMSFSYEYEGSYYDYILLDNDGIAGKGGSFPIWVQRNMIVNSTLGIRNSTTGNYNKIFNAANNQLTVEINVDNIGEGLKIQTASGTVLAGIYAGNPYPINLQKNTQVYGDFAATGSKNSLQQTENYGERLINAYETTEYFFGDIGSGIISNGECIVWIDDILRECINTNCEYHVFTQVYNGRISKIERFKDYFIVYGEDNTEFSWELKAKRLGYENVRLDKPGIEGFFDNSPIFEKEDIESKTSEDILLKELNFDLENLLMEG